jgi:hypothetical protein
VEVVSTCLGILVKFFGNRVFLVDVKCISNVENSLLIDRKMRGVDLPEEGKKVLVVSRGRIIS